MELRELIRDTLKEKMESQFKTLTAFAKASGVSQSYLSKIFGESAVDISPTILSKLLTPLQISLSQFFEEVEKKKALLNIQLSEDELKEFLAMIPNGEEKRGFIQKRRAYPVSNMRYQYMSHRQFLRHIPGFDLRQDHSASAARKRRGLLKPLFASVFHPRLFRSPLQAGR